MERILNLFRVEQKGVHSAALLLGFTAVFNMLLALVRDRMLAGKFGASVELDIYFAAFRIPDFIFAFALLFVASTAFIPIFQERSEISKEDAKKFLNGIFSAFFLIIGSLVILAYFALPFIVPFTVPGFNEMSVKAVISLSSIILLSPVMLGLSNLVSGVVQSYRRFFVYALSPIFYNAGIVTGILLFVPRYGLKGLAFGIVLGAFMHLLIQFPSLMHLGFIPNFGRIIKRDVLNIIKLSFPRALALSFHQFTFLAVTAIASTMGAGSIAVFNLSYNLQSLPLVVVGLSYSIAAFPTLSRLSIKNEKEKFFAQFAVSLRHILFWTIPISFLFIVYRAHIVRIILGTGAFDWIDTRLTAASLLLFSIGIVAMSVNQLTARSYYASGRTREPVIYNFLGFVFVVSFSVLFSYLLNTQESFKVFFAGFLRVEGVEGLKILALPLAYSAGMIINAVLLVRSIWKEDMEKVKKEVYLSFKEIILAGLSISFISFVSLRALTLFFGFTLDTTLQLSIHAFLSIVPGIITGVVMLKYMNNREMKEITIALKDKFWRSKPVQPDIEHL